MTCDECRAIILETWSPGEAGPARVSPHLDACGDCRAWLEAFARGMTDPGSMPGDLTAGVLAATSGPACERARSLLASRADTALDGVDDALLAGHLEHCAACGAIAATLSAAQAMLPTLDEVDPGPGFAERVLAATSRKPVRPTLGERWRVAWRRLAKRPRFAWEMAYALTICWLVVFGPSVKAVEWTATAVTSVAREHVPSRLDAFGQTMEEWRSVVRAEIGTAGTAVEATRGSWAESAVAAFQAAVAWAGQAAIALLDSLESAAERTVAWFREAFGQADADRAEPRPDPARSPE